MVKQAEALFAKVSTAQAQALFTENLDLWLEASGEFSNPVETFTDGQELTSWNTVSSTPLFNLTGNANWVESGIGGLPSYDFEVDDSDCMRTAIDLAPLAAGDTTYTMIAVFQRETGPAHQVVMGQFDVDHNTSLLGRDGIDFSADSNQVKSHGPHGLSGIFVNVGEPTIVLMRVDTSLTTNPTLYEIDFFVNTHNVANAANITRSPDGHALEVEGFGVGCRSEHTASPIAEFDGLISEVMVYSSYLSDSEVENVVNYLADKYSITLN